MSFDPYGGYTPDKRPDEQPPRPAPAPGDVFAGRPAEPAAVPPPAAGAVREKVMMPGIFLIVVGVLNMFASGGLFFIGITTNMVPPAQIEAEMQKDAAKAKQLKQLQDMGWSIEDALKIYLYGGIGGGAAVLLLALLTILGGVCMVRMRGYAMAVLGSLIAAVPCLSPMSCPCVLGMAVGVWALAVLLNNDVRAAFGGPG